VTDLVPWRILEAIRTNVGLKEITIPAWLEEDGRIQYRGNLYIPESDALYLQFMQEHHHTALVGHPG